MAGQFSGKRVITGAHGSLTWDGMPVMEVTNCDVSVDLDRSDVYVGMDKDSKLNGIGGNLKFGVDHVFSRAAGLLEQLKQGKDPRVFISVVLADPDATGGGQERVNIADVQLTNFPLTSFTKGEHGKQEFSGRFCVVRDSEFADFIGV